MTAKWIDLEQSILVDDAGAVNFTSAGAIRLLPDNYGFIASANPQQQAYFGSLIVPGDLTLAAAEVYPVSSTQFLLMSTGTTAGVDDTLTVLQNGVATAPLSAGGALVLDAQTINQKGTLWAPLGSIVLGVTAASQIPIELANALSGNPIFSLPFTVSENVTLGAGSLTSVSAAGLDIPYGYTVSGKAWYLDFTGLLAENSSGTLFGNFPLPPLTAPPTKSISLFGVNIATQTGSVIDVSGGGDIYATEFTSGTGGSRNVLTTYGPVLTPPGVPLTYASQYPDGRQVYALVPSYEAAVAAYDPVFADAPYYSGQAVSAAQMATKGQSLSSFNPGGFGAAGIPFANGIAPGATVTLAGGNGIAAGSYVLLPGMYATLPGAYRVVQVAANAGSTTPRSSVTQDGSIYATGYVSNGLTGARAAQESLFQLQSAAVWGKSSDITITSGSSYFASLAAKNKVVAPPLPVDGGVLAFGSTGTLTLDSANRFAPGASDLAAGLTGIGGQVDIGAANILILASDQSAPAADAGYLVLDAGQISALGASLVVIGGVTSTGSTGTTIAATASNLEVATDSAHPLTGPDLVLVTQGGGNGITVDAGSVIKAVGVVPAGADQPIGIGSTGVVVTINNNPYVITPPSSGDGSLLRVSNGAPVAITRGNLPATLTGQIIIGTAPGTTALATGVVPVTIDGGQALAIDSSNVNVIAANTVLSSQNYELSASVVNIGGGDSGLVLTSGQIGAFAGAQTVLLRSASVFNFYGGVAIGDSANPIGTLTFDGAGFYSQGGTTTISATNVVLTDAQAMPNTAGAISGSGGVLSVNAGGAITQAGGAFVLGNFGEVSLDAGQSIGFSGVGSLDAGAAAVTLTAPELVVNKASTQALTTTGALFIASGPGAAPANAATNIGGALTLTAASIGDSGQIEALSGNVTLAATSGDITLGAGSRISAGGSALAIGNQIEDAPGGTVKLTAAAGNIAIATGATIDVSAAGQGYAGALILWTAPAGVATLDGALQGGSANSALGGSFALNAGAITGALPFAGFTGSFSVALGRGDIIVPVGVTLTSSQVLLDAIGGNVVVNGAIDASGNAGGSIALYGKSGVDVEGSLLAVGSSPTQLGGTVAIGTSGTFDPATGAYNATYRYESISKANSGTIKIGSKAVINVSGGTSEGLTGGTVLLRAPLLADGSVNVTLEPTATFRGARSVTLEAYAVWSTTDKTTGAQHFDGIIDPYGWYDSSGNQVYPTLNADHQTFYGYKNGDPTQGAGTLMGFIEAPGFTGVTNASGIANFQETPGVELDNPSPSINGGAISVLSPWDLGGGASISSLAYRVQTKGASQGAAPILTIRAAGDLNIKAGISDGFFQTVNVAPNGTELTNATALYTSLNASNSLNLGTQYGGASIQFTPSPFSFAIAAPDTAAQLGLTDANTFYQYYAYYQQYLAAYNSYYTADLAQNAGYYGPFSDQGGSTPPQSVTSLYAAANAVYSTTDNSHYGAYLTAYAAYVAAYGSWAQSGQQIDASASSIAAGTSGLPLPPLPPAAQAGAPVPAPLPSVYAISAVLETGPSASYRLTAGAVFGGANPLAVAGVGAGNVGIDGHTTYANSMGPYLGNSSPVIEIPTVVRTGTGSIDIAAAGDVAFLDQAAPGAVYTAGAAVATPGDFTAPSIAAYLTAVDGNGNPVNPNGLVSAPAWASGGGSVTVAAGRDIIGIETPVDPTGSQTGIAGGPKGQFWSDWYFHSTNSNGSSVPFYPGVNSNGPITDYRQTAAWVNYATFFQAFGALGGGNITLTAGRDITDIGASLPQTLLVSGGLTASDPPVLHSYGGGNLVVRAAGNLNSSDFLVGSGSGLIQIGGAVQIDPLATVPQSLSGGDNGNSPTGVIALPLLLAEQNGFITVNARGPVTLGNVYDPSMLPTDAVTQTRYFYLPGSTFRSYGIYTYYSNDVFGNPFTSYGPGSGVALNSAGGDVTAFTLVGAWQGPETLFLHSNAVNGSRSFPELHRRAGDGRSDRPFRQCRHQLSQPHPPADADWRRRRHAQPRRRWIGERQRDDA